MVDNNEIDHWITWRGKHLPVDKDGNIIKFKDIDGNNYEEYQSNRKKYVNENLEIKYPDSNENLIKRAVAYIDGNNVGYLQFKDKDDINVDYIYVNEEYRRLGIANKLVDDVKNKTKKGNWHLGNITDYGEKFWTKKGDITKKAEEDYYLKIR